MVQEADVMRAAAAIPDEQYNLMQLAEVTMAASKLSTTNVQQIKAYFRHEESEEDDGIVIEDVSSSPNSRSSCPSMSDEEADKQGVIYNYSHKIFDRRKARKAASDSGLRDELQAAESNEEIYGLSHLDDLNSSSEDIHTCPECGKKYSTSSNLARHRQTHR